MGFFDKIKQGLSKTASSISSVFTASELDDDFYDELEESLILADLGVDTTTKAVERLRRKQIAYRKIQRYVPAQLPPLAGKA